MSAIKNFLISILAITLMIVAMVFVAIGLVAGFIWEHMVVGFIVGKMSPDWIGGLLEKHFPKEKKT